MSEKYDAIVLGAGQSGNPLAGLLASQGQKVLLVEKDKLGGSCINTGCTPSKTLYEAARKIHHAQNLEYAGFTIKDHQFNFKELMDHVRKLRDKFHESLSGKMEETENLHIMYGHGRFTGNKSIAVKPEDGEEQHFEAAKVFINTGSRPRIPEIKGLENIAYLTNENIWKLNEQPRKLAIIGGGYIGMEFAQSFARLGTQVSVITRDQNIIPKEDPDIIDLVQEKLEEEGVQFFLQSEPASVKSTGNHIQLQLKDGSKLECNALLIATGRVLNSDAIGLEHTGIETDDRGSIKVNEYLQTAVEGVYATGEVAGSPQFTHISYDDYKVLRDALENKSGNSTKGRIIPYTLFIDPQLGRFGLNEKQARGQKLDFHLYELPMKSFARAAERNEPFGKAKVLCDQKGGKILGASILGTEGGELMSLLQTAMRGGLTADDLKEMTFAHPLLAEGLNNLFA